MGKPTKMTVKVYAPLWEDFDARISRLPVSRDRFLSHVIEMETPRLADAMAGKKLSSRARGHISSTLASMGTKTGDAIRTVNIGVDEDVAHALRHVVKASNLVRDGFFNRLILFLRSSDALLDRFDLPRREHGEVGKSYGNSIAKPVSPLTALEEIFDDPLWYLHMAVQEIYETNLYLLDLASARLDGFACWLDDSLVPGTRANRRERREQDEFLKSLEDLELDAFSSAKVERA
jgi:hypothetical protein